MKFLIDKSTVFILLLLVLCGCDSMEKPIFQSFTPLEIVSVNAKKASLKASIKYTNPNAIGGKLEGVSINIYGNDVLVSTIDEELDIEIKANETFEVPIVINVPIKDLLNSDSGLIGGLVNAFLSKKVSVKYEGSARVKFAKVGFDLPIEKEEEVEIKI